MKIFEQIIIDKVRLTLRKAGFKDEWITLCECTMPEVEKYLKDLINKQEIDLFASGPRTGIDIREEKNSKNGKSISISFRGIDPPELKELIVNAIKSDL